LDFLSLINLPADEIEAVYLNTIFKLKDDETMITQLADFVEYSSI